MPETISSSAISYKLIIFHIAECAKAANFQMEDAPNKVPEIDSFSSTPAAVAKFLPK